MSEDKYKILINDRAYTSWTIVLQDTFKPADISISPFEHKLFTDDVFTCNTSPISPITSVSITHSTVRLMTNIPAVLIINDGKTFGRKKDKLFYKCIPDDKRLPIFIVAYELKHIGFFKTIENLYVTIQFESWKDKHPVGSLIQTIGTVDILENFYEYQLYCKSLNHSIQKFNKHTLDSVKQYAHDDKQNFDNIIDSICEQNKSIKDKSDRFVFTIDPASCGDYDDAFSILPITVNGINKCIINIYISNVPILLNALNIWSSFSKRISTIYLPDKKRPMLPTILSERLCSLQEQCKRIAFTMELTVLENGIIENIRFFNCKIFIAKNFAYESKELLCNFKYNMLLKCTRAIAHQYKYINHINDSHELVAYLMILINYHSAKDMTTFGNGIFRTIKTIINKNTDKATDNDTDKATDKTAEDNDNSDTENIQLLPEPVHNFIKIWRSSCGQYIDITKAPSLDYLKHSILELDAYIHITSPIRRLVDLLNMMQFQKNHNLFQFSKDSDLFYSQWLEQLDYINTTMRTIRKVQTDCDFLALCSHKEETLANPYDGYCFDKIARENGLFQYNVYLPKLKMASRITTNKNMANYDKQQYKLFLFNNEDNFKKKIRLQLTL